MDMHKSICMLCMEPTVLAIELDHGHTQVNLLVVHGTHPRCSFVSAARQA